MPKDSSAKPDSNLPIPRVPLNTKRAYYTMGITNSERGTHTFLTKYGYVYPASEFENDGRVSFTISCRTNDKIETEIARLKESVLALELFSGYEFKSPVKERDVDGEPVKFINIKFRRDIKNPDTWMFQGSLPEKDEDCILKLLPRFYVVNEYNEIGVYFELKAVEK